MCRNEFHILIITTVENLTKNYFDHHVFLVNCIFKPGSERDGRVTVTVRCEKVVILLNDNLGYVMSAY